ncbi:recombinase family protein [Peribacillus frigoritolerans]|uniref:recombinase family protein n=1 Tax=Peribacillus frigoritolerans TaxID=450367 RepID=UPI002889F361|nr:recombinase family protein [Peribacillus frigoritolerans]
MGYARISSKTQNVDRQIKELNEYGCDKIFIDIASGRDFKRTEYQKMKNILRFDDELVIHDLSRFGRNKEEILQEWKEIMELEADITVLNMPILNTAQYKESKAIGKLVSDIFLTVLSWTVVEERKRIKEAQKEGIAIAKERGKFKRRPTKYHANAKDPKDRLIYNEIIRLLNENESVKNISEKTGVTRMTIYNIKKKYEIV